MNSLVMTVEECAQQLKVSSAEIINLINGGNIKAKTIGNEYRILTHSFLNYLEIMPSFNYPNQFVFSYSSNKTMNTVMDEVIEIKRCSVTNNTFEWLCGVGNHIRKFLGEKLIGEVTSNDLQEFYMHLNSNNCDRFLSKRMIMAIKDLMNFIFKYSQERKYIFENPMISTIRLPKCSIPNPHKRFMDYDQINTLLNMIKENPTYFTVTKLLVMSGLRIGEALGLFWEDVDFDNNYIHINHALVRDYKYENDKKIEFYRIGNTKTPESVRDIPVLPEVIQLLRAWKQYIKSNITLQNKITLNHTSHLVFPNKNGKLQNIHTFRTNYRVYIKNRRGDYLDVSFHRLRHSYGSFLLEQGEELITVSRLLGHKTIRVTADIYCTVTNRLKLQAADKTINIWNKLNSSENEQKSPA